MAEVADAPAPKEITHPDAKRMWRYIEYNRGVNREFYRRVSPEDLDVRIVGPKPTSRPSASTRENIVDQIDTARDYTRAIRTGSLSFNHQYDDLATSPQMSLEDLLALYDGAYKDMFDALCDPSLREEFVNESNGQKMSVIDLLARVNGHEVGHQMDNGKYMDYLGMEKGEKYIENWGKS